MMFYFVAIVPSVDNAAGGKIYATPWDAADSCDFLNEIMPPFAWKVYQAGAVNVQEIQVEKEL